MGYEVLWDLPSHTVGKHDVLVAYLEAWLPILGKSFGRAIVVDGFAGPGEYQRGEPGSPLLSWRTAGEHKAAGRLGSADLEFRFLDVDARAVAHLRPLLGRERRYDGMSFSVEHAVCADVLPEILDDCRVSHTPVFVMLDPKGLKGVSMDLISEILSVPSGEVLFSFMHETAVRFGGTPKVDPYLRQLVGDAVPHGSSPEDYCDALEHRFRSLGAHYVLRFGLWQGGRHVYTLFFGTCNPLGCEKMKDAMWSVARDGSYHFDGLRRRQRLLLDPSFAEYFPKLSQDLVGKFGYNCWVSIDELDRFMQSDETLFRKAHLRDKVLTPLQAQGRLEVSGTSRRRKFTPGEGISVKFLRDAHMKAVTQKPLL